MANTFVAHQVLAQVMMFPETHDQQTWVGDEDAFDEESQCGTTMCLAGWAVHFSDQFNIEKVPCTCLNPTCTYNSVVAVSVKTGLPEVWEVAGAEALGIDLDT